MEAVIQCAGMRVGGGQTLTLVRFQRPHSLQAALRGSPSVVYRDPVELPPVSKALEYRHIRASLEQVDLGFAGRQHSQHGVHRAIAALSPGDALEIRVAERGSWELLDRAGMVVGRLSRSFKPPAGMRCRVGTVLAIVEWGRKASDPLYQDRVKSDSWEVVVPELVFEPDEHANG